MPSRKKFLARAGRDRASHARDARARPRCGRRRLRLFDRWLLLKDDTCSLCSAPSPPTISQRPGLGLIAPPSSAKTEILNSTSSWPHVVQAATVTLAGLLSGTPKKQHAAGAKFGLLRQIGDFGIIIVKDFGSVLLMHPETKAETLAYCVKSMMAAGSAISAAMGAEHCTGTARWASFRLHWGDRSPPSCCAAWAPTQSWRR